MGMNGERALTGDYQPEPCKFCKGRMVMIIWNNGQIRVHATNGTVWCDDEL